MKNIWKQEKGVSLISLAAAIIVIGIITTMLLYSVGDTKDITKLTNMYSDIDNLSEKIASYYSTYGKVPAFSANGLSTVISEWKNSTSNPIGENDSDNSFLVIDLNAIENLTLNYGKAFESVKNSKNISSDEDKDIYIINEKSHNVFYLKGIKVGENNYYTNRDKDVTKIDLRYVDGIKIPDGYSYVSGRKTDKNNEILIKKDNIEYRWANIEDGIYKLSNNGRTKTDIEGTQTQISIDTTTQSYDKLVESVNEFGGFYYIDDNGQSTVLYFPVEDKWSEAYDLDTKYTDKNGDTAYIPKGFQISELNTMNTINKGLVIRNATTLDEYVWIDVPDYVLNDAKTLDEIEKALKDYASTYSESGYEDSWYEGCGIADQETYNDLKNKMYLSIKDNGGFYIGRYEAGKNDDGSLVSQKEKNTYNNITVAQAQSLASNVNGVECTTSLMFGIQWDLICKFIEETGTKTFAEIKEDSTSWGNYKNSDINYIYGTTNYNKPTGTANLIKTGSSLQTKVLNIFDLAGNEMEFTLQRNTNNCILRGGGYQYAGYGLPMNYYYKLSIEKKYTACGFRVTLFK